MVTAGPRLTQVSNTEEEEFPQQVILNNSQILKIELTASIQKKDQNLQEVKTKKKSAFKT